jgi:small subunit ribosomal protein S17
MIRLFKRMFSEAPANPLNPYNLTPGSRPPWGGGKLISGIVTRRSMQKTAAVMVTRLVRNERLKMYIKRRRLYMVHDENEETYVGDRILFQQSRPYSKTKHWVVAAIHQPHKPTRFLLENPEYMQKGSLRRKNKREEVEKKKGDILLETPDVAVD